MSQSKISAFLFKFLSWNGRGQKVKHLLCKNFRSDRRVMGCLVGLPSYCFLLLELSLNLLDHSDCPPVVTRSLLTAPKCHTSSRRCGGNRNGAINICQQTVDILSPPPTIYVAPPPHAFMLFCWASDSTTGRPRRSAIQICQSSRIDWFHT